MKKIAIAVVLLASAGLLMAAQVDKYYSSAFEKDVDSIYTSVDSASIMCWEPLDTMIVVQTDSAYGIVIVSGVAEMSSTDILYIGLGADSTHRDGRPNLNTWMIRGDGRGGSEVASYPFSFQYPYASLATDTLYVFGATKERTTGYKVRIKDGIISCQLSLAVGAGVTGY